MKPQTYQIPVYAIDLVAERMMDGPTVTGPEAVAKLACDYLAKADREVFVVILLAMSGKVIGIHPCSIGSLSAAVVSPREVFKVAILGNAAAIIVAHNHPSGNLEPSAEDLAITRRLSEGGRILDLPLRDSLIVTATGDYTSLAERGVV